MDTHKHAYMACIKNLYPESAKKEVWPGGTQPMLLTVIMYVLRMTYPEKEVWLGVTTTK